MNQNNKTMSNTIVLNDESPMPFGKHEGEKMANVPDSYLNWLYDSFNNSNRLSPTQQSVKTYIEDYLH